MQAAREPGVWTRRRVATLVIGYLVGLGGMILVKGVFLSADRYFLILLVPAIALGVGRAYVRDFLPFIALVLVYEEARGLAHTLHPHPFYEPMLTLDRWIGLGEIPTVRLQGWLWHGHLEWYDHALSLLDRLHFIVPPTLLLLIWLERREVFYRCAITLLTVSFAGALTFLIFPAAPPWLASKHGLVPHVYRIGYIEGGDSPVATSSRGSRRISSATRWPPCPRCTPLTQRSWCCSSTPGAAGAGRSAPRPTRSGCGSRSCISATTTSPTSSSGWPTRSPAGSWFRSSSGTAPSGGCSGRSRRP